jgi:hypothetical protein
MDHVNRLLDILYSWVPLSASFRIALKGLIYSQRVQAKTILLEPPAHALKGWFSVDCFIAAYAYDGGGQEHVERIYLPNDLFTDLFSFFQNKPSRLKLIVIEGEEMLFIKLEDFRLLKTFTEMVEIVQYAMLKEHELESWRAWVMTLNDRQKVYQFSLHYPVHLLPNHICASFLQMTPSRFSAEKGRLTRRG